MQCVESLWGVKWPWVIQQWCQWGYKEIFCEIKGVEDLKLDFIDFWPQCALDDCQNFPLHTWSLKGCVREIRTRCNNKNLAKLASMLCLWWCPNLADLLCLSQFNCFFFKTHFFEHFLYLYTFFQAWISGLKSWFVGILIDMFASIYTGGVRFLWSRIHFFYSINFKHH